MGVGMRWYLSNPPITTTYLLLRITHMMLKNKSAHTE